MSAGGSYHQILRSSSVMGGAQIIGHLAGLLRVKSMALLLGPAGVGIVGLYTAATNLLGTVTAFGLQASAVRAIASADALNDPLAVARTISMLRKLCWVSGLLGWLVSVTLAIPLSRLMFESTTHAWALAALGVTLLVNAVSNGQVALLQGLRRIGDLARLQVAAALLNTAVAIALYAWLGERGIVPVLIADATVSLGLSWWFARRVQPTHTAVDWREAMADAKPLLSLGLAMMISSVLTLLLDLYTRTLVTRQLGVEAAGIYQAAWVLSGLFAGFVLGAMGMDFFPRLTAVIHDRPASTCLVNEQTEIGILLALPGLLFTLALAEWLVWAVYSATFIPAADVLVWMVLGVFGRVVSWPLGYIQLALGAGRWFVATEVTFLAIQAALVVWLLPRHGVVGAGYALAACYGLYALGMACVAWRLIGFTWSPTVWRMIGISSALVLATLAANRLLSDVPATLIGCLLSAVGSVWSLRELVQRVGHEHHLIHLLLRVPGIRRIAGA